MRLRSRFALIALFGAMAVFLGAFLRPALVAHYGISFDPQYQSCLPWDDFVVRYGPVHPQVGGLVAFHYRKMDLIAGGQRILVTKYVAGIAGDRVRITKNAIWVNGHYWGKRWLLPWARHERVTVLSPRSFVIPKGKILVLGTTPGAWDGRYWGLLPKSRIMGRCWPF